MNGRDGEWTKKKITAKDGKLATVKKVNIVPCVSFLECFEFGCVGILFIF